MQTAARYQAVFEILSEVFENKTPADVIMSNYMKSRKYIGSKDRRFILDTSWEIIRSRMRLSFEAKSTDVRKILLMYLKDQDFDIITGGEYGLSPLTQDEKKWLKSLSENEEVYPPYVELECPEWLFEKIGDPALIRALNAPASVDIRANFISKLELKNRLKGLHINTLVSPHMPPYIRQLGPAFDVLIILLVLYLLVQTVGLVAHWIFYRRAVVQPANPNSLYPIRFARLYGTPSLIFRAKDNQGNTLIALSSRWDSLFLWSGSLLIVFTLLTLGGAGLCEALHLWTQASFAYNTLYSVCSLLLPLGMAIFCCGVVWSQLVLSEISLFDRKENKAALLVQKGFALTKETYEIYFARSKDKLVAVRTRFRLRRTWKILSKDGQEIARITEKSLWRSVLRRLTGHLWGFFRADYQISGQMDSQGTIQNDHAAFNRFTCNLDKPEAINARDMLAVSLLINIRDRDKWYPWVN